MDDGERFFHALHHGIPGLTEIRPRPGQRRTTSGIRRWIPTSDPKTAWLWALGSSGMGLDVYFGVMPRSLEEGGSAAVAALSAVYVDVDDPAEEVLHNRDVMAFPWTAIVISGWGVHLHGRFADPLDPAQDLDRWNVLERSLIRMCAGDPSVCDTARILRVPGTRSWKRGGAPVTLVDLRDWHAPVEAWEEAVGLGSGSCARILPFVQPSPTIRSDSEIVTLQSGQSPQSIGGGKPTFAWLRDRVGVSRVLRHYQIAPANGGWRGPCFLHGGDNLAAFTITSDDRRWMCWTRGCGQPGGSVVDLALLLESGDVRSATRMLHELAGGPPASRSIWRIPER